MRTNTEFPLTGNWFLSCSGGKNSPLCVNERIPALVPGDIILDLMRAGKLPDPVIRDNHLRTTFVGQTEWILEKEFSGTFPPGEKHELVLDGIAYLAKVELNGKYIATHRNMHRPLRVDVSDLLKDGEVNVLRIHLCAFDESIKDTPVIEWWDGWAEAIHDRTLCRKRGAARKADYTYGWDWTQGLPVCGIERGAYLETTKAFRIYDEYYRGAASGRLNCSFMLDSIQNTVRPYLCELTVKPLGSDSSEIRLAKEILIGPGQMKYSLDVRHPNPSLWFPHGYGPQNRYEAILRILGADGVALAEKRTVFAFRDIRLEEEKISDRHGTFRFIVNGIPIFATGANWIPADIIPGRVSEERCGELLRIAAESNLNYFRIWGGGTYESDLFYDLCDEYGILIWQDFMFSGPEVPEFDPAFRAECCREAGTALRRLRNHPCIVMWCGSNETDAFYESAYDLSKERPGGHYYGWRLLHQDFPEIVERECPGMPYVPSCPWRGSIAPEEVDLNDAGFGTCHICLGSPFAPDSEFESEPVAAFDNEVYGVSPCVESSLRRFLAPDDLADWDNPVMRAHNIMDLARYSPPHVFAGFLTFDHPARIMGIPPEETFAWYHLQHIAVVKGHLEFLRRNLRYAGGIAFWMFNSAYPSLDWSLVDYYGVPKPVYYEFRRMNAPLLPIPAVGSDGVELYLSNITGNDEICSVELSLLRFDGTVLKTSRKKVVARKAGSQSCGFMTGKAVPGFLPEETFVLGSVVKSNGETVRNHRFFCAPKALRLPETEVTFRRDPQDPAVFHLKSRGFAGNVVLAPYDAENRPDDNWFDLYPGVEKTVRFLRPPETVVVHWENRPGREPFPVKLSKTADRWSLTLYNPAGRRCELPLSVESESCIVNLPETVAVPPHGVVSFDLLVKRNPLAKFRPVGGIDLFVGKKKIREAIFSTAPEGLHEGILRVENPGRDSLVSAPVTFAGMRKNGEEYRKTTPPITIPPGKQFEFDFIPPDDLLPCGGTLSSGGEVICPVLSSGGKWEKNLPLVPFDGKKLDLFPGHSLLNGHGARIVSDRFCEQFDNPPPMSTALFLHLQERTLILDLLVGGIPLVQRKRGIAAYQDACVEFVLGTSDNSVFQDYSLAQTENGPEVYLRRERGTILRTGDDCPGTELAVRHTDDGPLTHYHFTIDCERTGLLELVENDEFKAAFVIRAANNCGLRIFNGIQPGKGVEKAGRVIIHHGMEYRGR